MLATLTNVMIGMLLALLVAISIVKINQSSDSVVSTLVDQPMIAMCWGYSVDYPWEFTRLFFHLVY